MDGIIAPAPAAHGLRLSYTGGSCLTAASVVVLLLYLTGRFIWLYNKDAATAAAAAASSSSPSAAARCVLVRAVSMSSSLLQVFVHVPAAPDATGNAPRAPECAVCLSELRERETGRLLPVCGHGFHEECIVTWLRVNTTCPLCRAAVAAK
uniref:RING-type domain-containing protein n=1 Tax=Oryza glumipatula TaxID=40148 RepID=A0A0E0AP94_9ORYZ